MFHLIIEQGNDVGREVTVPSNGIKFGRSPANNLVLDDESVMLFHGRFFFKSDGTLWVTDFGAGEKTVVEGLPVDEYQLKVGELIQIGKTAFRVVNVKPSEQEEVAVISSGNESIDLGFKKNTTTRHARKVNRTSSSHHLIPRLLQVGVIFLVLIVFFFVVPEIVNLFKDNQSDVKEKDLFILSYERVQANKKNIFRYKLTLDVTGKFIVVIDDLKNNRHIQKEKVVSKILLSQLSDDVNNTGFFQVDSDFVGEEKGQYDSYNLIIARNLSFNQIHILNRKPPQVVKRTVAIIESFALDELGIPLTLFKDNDELMRYARIAVNLGHSKYRERDVSYNNLADAIFEYKKAMLYLETIEPKPELYRVAEQGFKKVKIEQDKRYEEYMFRADRAYRLHNWNEAVKYLRILSALIPDRSDKRHEKINVMLLKVEKHLR